MAIVWVAGERCDVGDKLPALAVMQRGSDADFDPEFVGSVRLAFTDAFHFRGVQRIDLRPALATVLVVHTASQTHRPGEDLLQGVVPAVLRPISRITRPR
jgi:hypothetical protein